MGRSLRPRATEGLAIVPVAVTDRTAPAVLGLEPRVFREFLLRHDVPHRNIGRRVIARVVDVVAALDASKLESDADASEPVQADDDDSDLESVDAVLAGLGRRRRRRAE